MAKSLIALGYKLVTDGTDNHLILLDLKPQGITGNKLEKVCELANITVNKNSIPGDKSAVSPGGVRLGTPALTTRGFVETHFEQIAEFIHEAIKLTIKIQDCSESKLIKHFLESMPKYQKEINALKENVENFAKSFPMPGFVNE